MAKKRKVPVNIYVSENIAEKLSKVKHGFKSALMEKLLSDFFEKVGEDEATIMAYVLGLDISAGRNKSASSSTTYPPPEQQQPEPLKQAKEPKPTRKISIPDDEDFLS